MLCLLTVCETDTDYPICFDHWALVPLAIQSYVYAMWEQLDPIESSDAGSKEALDAYNNALDEARQHLEWGTDWGKEATDGRTDPS